MAKPCMFANIATPIFYVNDVPHIGHAYTEVAADVLARWHRQAGDDAWLLTHYDVARLASGSSPSRVV